MHTFDGVDLVAFLLAVAAVVAIIRARRDNRRHQIEDIHARNRRIRSTIDRIGEQTYRNELRHQLDLVDTVGERLAA